MTSSAAALTTTCQHPVEMSDLSTTELPALRRGIHQMRGEEVITPELETSHLTINRLSSCSPTPSNPQRRPITLCWPLSGRPNIHQHTHSHYPLDSASVSKSRNCTKLFFEPPVRPGKWAYVQFVGTIDESHSSAQPQSSRSGHWASHSTYSYFLWSGYWCGTVQQSHKASTQFFETASLVFSSSHKTVNEVRFVAVSLVITRGKQENCARLQNELLSLFFFFKLII